MTDREKIIEVAKQHGCTMPLRSGFGDCRVPQLNSVENLEAFYRAAQAEAFEQAAVVCETAEIPGVNRRNCDWFSQSHPCAEGEMMKTDFSWTDRWLLFAIFGFQVGDAVARALGG
jgi:hypothetical protein